MLAFLRKITPCCAKDEIYEERPLIPKQQNFRNFDFIGDVPQKSACIAKQTLKNFSLRFSKRRYGRSPKLYQLTSNFHVFHNSTNNPLKLPYLFQKLHSLEPAENVKVSDIDFAKHLPWTMLAYIAHRVAKTEPQSVIDATCESGALAILLSGAGIPSVQGFEDTEAQIAICEANAQSYKIRNIDFTVNNFLGTHLGKVGTIIIRPKYEDQTILSSLQTLNQNRIYSAIPSLEPYLKKALKLANSIVLILPPQITSLEIGVFLSNSGITYVELQEFNLNGKTLVKCVYIGEIVNSTDEFHGFLAQRLLTDHHPQYEQVFGRLKEFLKGCKDRKRVSRLALNAISSQLEDYPIDTFLALTEKEGLITRAEAQNLLPGKSYLYRPTPKLDLGLMNQEYSSG